MGLQCKLPDRLGGVEQAENSREVRQLERKARLGPQARATPIIDIDNITRAAVMGLEGAEEPWYRTPVNIILLPSGRAVRVESIKYSLNGGIYETYEHPINLPAQSEYSLQWYGILPDGEAEASHSINVAVDYEEPESEAGITTVNDVEYLALSAVDNLSGVARIEYSMADIERVSIVVPDISDIRAGDLLVRNNSEGHHVGVVVGFRGTKPATATTATDSNTEI